MALLSSRSVNKRGYVQKEIRQALETLETVPEDQIFIVPVRLDECKPSHSVLEDLHWLDLFPRYDHGLQRLLDAVGDRADAARAATVADQDVTIGREVAAGPKTGKGAPPYRVLIVAANPVDTARIRVDQEAREISNALNGATQDKIFDVKYVLGARVADLRRQLLEYGPQLVHISSHGNVSGVILEDDTGRSQVVGTRTMRSLIHLFREGLECVVLNATFSEKMAEAISEDVDYVIGMCGAMSDEAALQFSISFYESLAAGKCVDFAYSYACSALALEKSGNENVPRLFQRR